MRVGVGVKNMVEKASFWKKVCVSMHWNENRGTKKGWGAYL
jgi:hypothetical protein